MQSNKVKRNIIWNIIGSMFYAFNSLFFLIIVTRINGVDSAGVFTFAFSMACMLYIIGIYSGRAFQVTDQNPKITDSDYFYSKIVTCLIMVIVGFIFCLIKKYSLEKDIILMLLIILKAFEAFSEVLYATIQKNDNLDQVGISLFLKSIISILVFIIIDLLTKNIIISIVSMILINILVILFYDCKRLKEVSFKIEKPNFKNIVDIIKYGFCAFLFAFLTQYVINAPKYAIDDLLSNELQTIYGIIVMPSTIMILTGQFIVHPFLLRLKDNLNDKKKFVGLTLKLLCPLLIVGIFVIGIAYLLGIPVLELLYGLELDKYRTHLLIILVGAVCYGATVIFSTSLITMRSTFSQVIVYLITSIVAYFLSNILISNYSLFGASLTYLLSMVVLLILYVVAFIIIVRKYKIKK